MSRIVRSASSILAAVCCLAALAGQQAQADVTRKAECHRMLADIYDRQGKTHEAMAEYNAEVAASPSDADAWFNFGKFLLRQRETKLAAIKLKKAAELEPGRTELWLNLGNACLFNKDYNAAIDALRRAGPQGAPLLQQAEQYRLQIKQQQEYNKQQQQQQQQQDQ
jgi:tetratricopeptide (TPR) repeat protein